MTKLFENWMTEGLIDFKKKNINNWLISKLPMQNL